MDIKDFKPNMKVWTMIGNYPYEVEVIRIKDNSHYKPQGTYQQHKITVWREDKDTTHDRKVWECFKSKEDIKEYLFPTIINNIVHPCIKVKGWWIFKYKVVEHDYKTTYVDKFMSTSSTFHVHSTCKNCKSSKVTRFVEKDTLILMGIPIEDIETITNVEGYTFKN